jgi:hypothetical protein
VSTEPIIFETDEEVEFWKATYIKAIGIPAADWADEAVRELRARMPAAQVQPTYPPGEEPRVVRCEDGQWLIVRGKYGLEWWSPDTQMWSLHSDLGTGIYLIQSDAASDFASMSPAQLAAQVGVECKA